MSDLIALNDNDMSQVREFNGMTAATRTQTETMRVREIHRDISRATDGSEKRLEHELIHEQISFYQERLEREVNSAKTAYIERITHQQQKELDAYHQPHLLKKKYYSDRAKVINKLIKDEEIPVGALTEILAEEKEAIQLTVLRLQKKILSCTKMISIPTTIVDVDQKKPGSRIILLAIEITQEVFENRKKAAQLVESVRADNTGGYLVVNKGVYTRKAPPTFPFSSKYLAHKEPPEAKEMEKYLKLAVKSDASDSDLYRHVLQMVLTARMLTQECEANSYPSDDPWPMLIEVTEIEEKDFEEFVFLPTGFAEGKSTFGMCSFEIDNVVYDNIWLEIALLMQTPPYSRTTAEAYYALKVENVQSRLHDVNGADELIDVDPNCPDFHKLKKIQRQMEDIVMNNNCSKQTKENARNIHQAVQKLAQPRFGCVFNAGPEKKQSLKRKSLSK